MGRIYSDYGIVTKIFKNFTQLKIVKSFMTIFFVDTLYFFIDKKCMLNYDTSGTQKKCTFILFGVNESCYFMYVKNKNTYGILAGGRYQKKNQLKKNNNQKGQGHYYLISGHSIRF